MAVAFTDGASRSNGKKDCRCGSGVYSASVNISMNLSQIQEKFEWTRRLGASNNVGELLGIFLALHHFSDKTDDLIIYTDSMYSINCITKWYKKWELNGWQTASGDVKNREIIEKILELKKKFKGVFFIHVRSHQKEPIDRDSDAYTLWYGNDMADKLASACLYTV